MSQFQTVEQMQARIAELESALAVAAFWTAEPGITIADIRAALKPIAVKLHAKDFGATGDGTTDDTAAIQAAINYLQTEPQA